MSKINGAQSLVNALEAAGVEVMFGAAFAMRTGLEPVISTVTG